MDTGDALFPAGAARREKHCESNANELARVPALGTETESIWLVTPSELRRTRAVRAALDLLVDVFATHQRALLGATPRAR